ncbi:MAG: hypothetical protein R2827_02970 [Bdellovibrionales bacterium]
MMAEGTLDEIMANSEVAEVFEWYNKDSAAGKRRKAQDNQFVNSVEPKAIT